MKKKIKIIVIGGTGFLGFHFSKLCLKKKMTVISLSRKKPPKNKYLEKVKYLHSDISIKSQIFKNLKYHLDADFIVNFGGEVNHKRKNNVLKSHYFGVKNISEIFLDQNLKKFIQIGTSLEYGKSKSPHNELIKPKPISDYGKAKFIATTFLLNLYKKKNFPVSIVRPYQVYGPYQDKNRLIPIVIKSSLKNIKFPCSNGNQFRDFLYVDDFVRFIFQIMNSKNKDSAGEIFNVGYGKTIKVKTVIQLINSLIKKGKPIFGKIKLRKEENLITYPNIKKAKILLKWKPKISFREGIKKTINFYKKER
tara:strand:- start:11470 stop:12390 length:921 start_codon:yes stop_codon:yes gene_type:complete